MDITQTTAVVGAAFGLIGTTLGAVNTWRSIARDRVHVVVRPAWMIIPEPGYRLPNGCLAVGQVLGIKVVNLSHFAVTIDQAGFLLKGKDGSLALFYTENGEKLPRRLEPRASLTVLGIPVTVNFEDIRSAEGPYVDTGCGCRFQGSRHLFRRGVERHRPAV